LPSQQPQTHPTIWKCKLITLFLHSTYSLAGES
jgi:hypothetical protein